MMKNKIFILLSFLAINIIVSQDVKPKGLEYLNATEETDFSNYNRFVLMNSNGLSNAFIHSDSIALKSHLLDGSKYVLKAGDLMTGSLYVDGNTSGNRISINSGNGSYTSSMFPNYLEIYTSVDSGYTDSKLTRTFSNYTRYSTIVDNEGHFIDIKYPPVLDGDYEQFYQNKSGTIALLDDLTSINDADEQNLSLNNDILSISNGNSVDLNEYNTDLSNYVNLDTFQNITALKQFSAGIELFNGNITGRSGTISLGLQNEQSTGAEAHLNKASLFINGVVNNTTTRLTAKKLFFNDKVSLGIDDAKIVDTVDDVNVIIQQKSGTIALLEDIPISESTSYNTGIGFADFEASDTGEKLQVNGLIRSNATVAELEIADEQVNITKAYLESILNPTPIKVGATGAPQFENGWTNYGSLYGDLHYYKIGNRVYLRGFINGGVGGVFTLPIGYRPSSRTVISTIDDSGIARIDVNTSGLVESHTSNSNFWLSLNNISFIVE